MDPFIALYLPVLAAILTATVIVETASFFRRRRNRKRLNSLLSRMDGYNVGRTTRRPPSGGGYL